MPGPTIVPVNVVVNFNGVSYNPATQQWSGAPVFTVPPSVPVSSGDNTIAWNLQPAAVPGGFAAQFNATNGIVFDPGWVGGTPTQPNLTTYEAADNFQMAPGSDPEYYEYSINVSLTSRGNSAVTKSWSYDPDVENEPVIRHC